MRFICKKCNEAFNMPTKPNFCPNCGSQELQPQTRDTALECIKKYNAIIDKMKDIIDNQYAPLYFEAKKTRDLLRCYRDRGVITTEEIPEIYKPALIKKAYDKRRKK